MAFFIERPYSTASSSNNDMCSKQVEGSDMERMGGFLSVPTHFEQWVTYQLQREGQDTDRFMALQNERTRMGLQEQGNGHLWGFLRAIEDSTARLMTEKEAEIERARKWKAELEEEMRRVETMQIHWQRIAAGNEAMAVALTKTIDRINQRIQVQDTASSSFQEKEEEMVRCRACGLREARMLMLPCRHLCACGPCEVILPCCPVCQCTKHATIEVYFL
ncbi:hypothetical protein AMTRI_Chr09g18740 [Amborella trichopoda]|uniref:RING-type domain-containing protein n=1 Tax=Amborella trichopoda TaxID=13333 RepID=W1PEW0_AMBTC|nr:E3 ubiquitin-protein ligase BOI [Amborella trichopoda]ERN08512.1 hypothetical protein AMTR_s00152p00093450 [Amborella trichopoda]|eukprot:XP_006846931.1 E3 ubiquitin-protein ligase BOI [Amborella trichopoda]